MCRDQFSFPKGAFSGECLSDLIFEFYFSGARVVCAYGMRVKPARLFQSPWRLVGASGCPRGAQRACPAPVFYPLSISKGVFVVSKPKILILVL